MASLLSVIGMLSTSATCEIKALAGEKKNHDIGPYQLLPNKNAITIVSDSHSYNFLRI
jgi:hypothetical protein